MMDIWWIRQIGICGYVLQSKCRSALAELSQISW